jgi:rhodanese-related sulfurtransferase
MSFNIMSKKRSIIPIIATGALLSALAFNVSAEEGAGGTAVNITRAIASVNVKHGGADVKVERNQDTSAVIEAGFAKTSRPCPPFCAQPIIVADGVKTIGEAELVEFMQGPMAGGSGILVDARTPDWHAKGTIPGSISVPYTDVGKNADDISLEDAMESFGVKKTDDKWDFSGAKSLVLWCNGPWCGQSPAAIKGLIAHGYPATKLIYYRGGMQMWKIFGLTVSLPAEE